MCIKSGCDFISSNLPQKLTSAFKAILWDLSDFGSDTWPLLQSTTNTTISNLTQPRSVNEPISERETAVDYKRLDKDVEHTAKKQKTEVFIGETTEITSATGVVKTSIHYSTTQSVDTHSTPVKTSYRPSSAIANAISSLDDNSIAKWTIDMADEKYCRDSSPLVGGVVYYLNLLGVR